MMNESTEENVIRKPLHNKPFAEGRFASVSSVEEFILEQENKNTAQKTERDVKCKNISGKTLSTYEINTIQQGKCFVQFLFTRSYVSENSLVRCAHLFIFYY